MRPVTWTPLLVAMVLGTSPATAALDAQRTPRRASSRITLDDVATALGGRDRVLAVRTLLLEGTGENYNLGQNRTPDAPLPVFEVTEFRRRYDFPQRRWRLEQTRRPRFPTNNPAPQVQRFALDDGVAFNLLPDGSAQRVGSAVFLDRVNELLYHPIGLLQAALAPEAHVVTLPTPQGPLFRIETRLNEVDLFVDATTKLPLMALKQVHHPMLGDVIQETEFGDWREVDGLKLPMHIITRIDAQPVADIRLARAEIDADVGDLAAPASVRATAPPELAVNVRVDSVAPGIWHLAGQSHHSVAIEMHDHLVLVEAPQSDARTLAVIAKARELRPGKPVRAVINTHHHFDHAGGIRAAMAEDLTIITHAGNVAFFRALAQRPFTVNADTLARVRRTPRVEGVRTKRVISDSTRTVELHHIAGNRHAATLLMVYLPAERILVVADVYSPPQPGATASSPAVFAPNLVANIDRLGLEVDRIVPIHGPVAPMSALRAAATAAAQSR